MSRGKIAILLSVAVFTPPASAEIRVCQAPDGRKIVTNEGCELPFVATGAAIADLEERSSAPALEAAKRKQLEELKQKETKRAAAPEETLRREKARLQELERLKQTSRPLEMERLSRGQQ